MFHLVNAFQGRPRPQGQGEYHPPVSSADFWFLVSASAAGRSVHIEVRLPARTVKALLKSCSQSLREAWTDGLAVEDAPHRLKLVANDGIERLIRPPQGSACLLQSEEDLDVQFTNGEEWFEERAWECENEDEHKRLGQATVRSEAEKE
ncbi:hypothetical protein BDZ90DRAFT_234230 [Jaminaea rosea]|uniref:Uncharacterized protein n=1 Tax=Jaminaea rosea TaxID=1569628 RepID=A0A316UJC8_9BASI|nr:hypothetical protein BDZ90DRAFT_234230 [Jaminaea rosea]PWN25397.1 hypothetical protein BDZ90DRAFT_234230 [Jaminaea rosea]